MPATPQYDRSAEDVGNIVQLEHVNLSHDDNAKAVLFYLVGLGLTRDPYVVVGLENMWVNIGRSQVHLPARGPQRLRGIIGLVMPDLAALAQRLERVAPRLKETRFAYTTGAEVVDVVCPWGNRFRIHAAVPGGMSLGMPYVRFDVPRGVSEGIARFYRQVLGAPATVGALEGASAATVVAGPAQRLIFRENDAALPPYDGHHLQVYVADFSGPHAKLAARGLITEESDQYQYRFETIFDPEDGRALFEIQHEVRSLSHPLRGRELVNRDPAQSNGAYTPNGDRYRGRY
ncbi:MAG: hypothetical protein ACREUW_07450 [Burkholderiales bacterium]